MTGKALHPQSCLSGWSWMGVSEGCSALCCQPERQDQAGNTHFGASCQATQKLHNLISDGNRWPLFSQSQEPHDLSLFLLSALQAGCIGRLENSYASLKAHSQTCPGATSHHLH